MRHRIGLASIALMIVIAACAPSASPTSAPSPDSASPSSSESVAGLGLQPGSRAPDFTLMTLDGGEVSLSDYTGRPVFINFWASWCGPCRGEMPEIVAAYAGHKDAGLEVLAINLTFQDAVEDAQAFADEFQMPFPVLLDKEGSVSKAYSLFGLPTSVFIDTGGIVRVVNAGPMSREVIEQYLTQILPTR